MSFLSSLAGAGASGAAGTAAGAGAAGAAGTAAGAAGAGSALSGVGAGLGTGAATGAIGAGLGPAGAGSAVGGIGTTGASLGSGSAVGAAGGGVPQGAGGVAGGGPAAGTAESAGFWGQARDFILSEEGQQAARLADIASSGGAGGVSVGSSERFGPIRHQAIPVGSPQNQGLFGLGQLAQSFGGR